MTSYIEWCEMLGRCFLSPSPDGRLQLIQELLAPTDEDGNALEPLITADQARELLTLREPQAMKKWDDAYDEVNAILIDHGLAPMQDAELWESIAERMAHCLLRMRDKLAVEAAGPPDDHDAHVEAHEQYVRDIRTMFADDLYWDRRPYKKE